MPVRTEGEIMTELIGLLGKAGAGKDSVAAVLAKHGWHRVAFADPLKEVLIDINPEVDVLGFGVDRKSLSRVVVEFGWEGAKRLPDVRRRLQVLGASVRAHVGVGVWIDRAFRDIHELHARGGRVVVTDVRYRNEFRRIELAGGKLWRIERPGLDGSDTHASETDLDDWRADRTIINDGGLDDLRRKVSLALLSLDAEKAA